MERHERLAIEQQINDLAQMLYESADTKFIPCPPWVMVRVLPRHQQAGMVILPGDKQKPTHEGIVVRTWEPFIPKQYQKLPQGGMYTGKGEMLRSELQPGDHVVFPHWSGLPVPGYDEGTYRIVKEMNWQQSQEGGIFAVIDYEDKDKKQDLEMELYNIDHESIPVQVVRLHKKFVIFPKTQGSVTISSTKQE